MKAVIDAKEFKRLVDNTKKFLKDYGLMAWIFLEIEENTIKATALDGHRVSIEYAASELDEPFKCFIKPEIPKITKYDRYVELELNGDKAFVTVGDSIRGYKQPEGDYYKTDNLIDDLKAKEPVISVGVNARYLMDALKSADKKYNHGVILEIRGKKEPIVVKACKDTEDNIKLVLPINISEG